MKNTLIVVFLLAVASSGLMATDIFVQAGDNTITSALVTAEAGDRLVLVEEGVYSNDPLFVYKPVTIAAFDGLANKPVVSFLWSTDSATIAWQERTIAFTYASLTLEGLEFTMEGDSALTSGMTTRMFRNRAYTGVNWEFTDCLFRDASQATMSITSVNDSFKLADGSWVYDGVDYIDNDPVVIDGVTVAQDGSFGVLDTLIIDNCVFNNFLGGGPKINHKPGHGRGIYSYTQFTNNTVSNTDHHAIQFGMRDVGEGSDNSLYGTAVIDHNTIHGVAGGNRNGIFLKYVNSASTIMNTTLTDVGNQVINIQASESVLVDYCNWYNSGSGPVQQWTDGGHNLQVDPLFADASANDFTLLTGSPLIGAGSDGSNIGDPRWAPQAPNIDPVNTTAPQLSGTTVEGDILNVDNGVWTDDNGDVLTFTYTWYTDSDNQGNDGTEIANATDNTYTLTNADVDQYIYAMVTADDGNGGLVSVSSNYSTQVSILNIDPVNTTAPQLSGTTVEGDILNVDNGVWTDDNGDVLTFTYTWYTDSDNQGNDGTEIANATDNTYTLTNADVDQYIYAMVTADDGNGGLVSVSSNYSTQVSTLGIGDEIIITEYSLSQNYPNPFNPVTEITFELPNTGDISLKVFNMVGQEVALIASGNYPAGLYTVSFNGVDLPSGIYFYTLTGAGVNVTKKMILMK